MKPKKICWICKVAEATNDSDLCDVCEHKMELQEETGRCQFCGRPVLECVCEDD